MDGELLREADQTARQLGLSRSRLFSLAITDFLKHYRQENMLRRLNEVYGDGSEQAEKRLLNGIKTKVRQTVKESW